jgi:hypothetical protein
MGFLLVCIRVIASETNRERMETKDLSPRDESAREDRPSVTYSQRMICRKRGGIANVTIIVP